MIENIHSENQFDRKFFCNGIIPLTPDKPANDPLSSVSVGASLPPHQSAASTSSPPVLPSPISPLSSLSSPSIIHDIGPASKIPETPDTHMADIKLVERHSLSLRSPPLGSLADDILKSSNLQTQRIKAMMSEVKESLSDFGSCLGSSSSSDSDAENSGYDLFKTVERKKKKGEKGKTALHHPKNTS